MKTHIQPVKVNQIDVYLLLGDSREAGMTAAEVSLDPKYITTGLPRCSIAWKIDRTATVNTTIEPYSNRSPTWNRYPGVGARETGGNYTVGPDVSIAYNLNIQNVKKPVILKWTRGGGTLLTNTNDTGNDWQNVSGHRMFELLNYYLPQALAQLRATANVGKVVVRKVQMSIGTNDLIYGWNEANFKAALPVFINQIRNALTDPSLPVQFVMPDSNLYQETSVTPIPTQAMVDACRASLLALTNTSDPAYISGISVLDVSDLPLLADGLHKTQDGVLEQGNRTAQWFLSNN
jgi:hypothetical protein